MTTTVPAPKPAPRYAPPAVVAIPPAVDRLVAFVGDLDEPTAWRIHAAWLASPLAVPGSHVRTRLYQALNDAVIRAEVGYVRPLTVGRCEEALSMAACPSRRTLRDDPWLNVGDAVEDAAHALLVAGHLPAEARDALLAPVVAAGFEINPKNTDATEEAQR